MTYLQFDGYCVIMVLTKHIQVWYNTSMKKEVKLIQARVPVELHKAVKKKAIDEEITISALIRKLLENWLKEQEKKPE